MRRPFGSSLSSYLVLCTSLFRCSLTITWVMVLLFLVYQGDGLGYRYLHGLIGAFCRLGGFGWMRLSRPERPLSLSPIWLSVGFAVLASAFLIVKAHDFVKPYARAYHMEIGRASCRERVCQYV